MTNSELGSLVTSSELQCKKLSMDLISPQRIRCYSSNSHTVWDFVRGHVVVRQPLSLVPPLDGAGYLCQLLPELLHGLLHWLLYEVLIRIHAQVQLRGERGDTSLCLEARCMLKQKETCVCVCAYVCKWLSVCMSVCTSFSWYWLRAQTAPRCQLERPRSGRLSMIKFTSAKPFSLGGAFRMVDGALGIQEHQSYYTM